MSSAAAERMPEGKRAIFGDGKNCRWQEVWEHNPKIAGVPGKDTIWIPDYPGSRPYIDRIEGKNYVFREDFRAPYGKICLLPEELEWADRQIKGDFIIVEPHVKDEYEHLKIGANKAWNRWDELLKLDYPWLQIGMKQPKTRQVRTGKVRQALAMVARAKLVVTTDGMLHHAAAALGVPAIVLWGGLVSPKILGYPTHTNIWNGAKSCGSFAQICPHCREAMDSITVDQVKKCLP